MISKCTRYRKAYPPGGTKACIESRRSRAKPEKLRPALPVKPENRRAGALHRWKARNSASLMAAKRGIKTRLSRFSDILETPGQLVRGLAAYTSVVLH
jgi:hypothetical protein